MAISDILVYADPTAISAERLDIAFRLAHRFEAYLIGVVPEDATAVGEKFQKMLLNESLLGEWHMAIGLTESVMTRWAHCADLVILGQRIPDHDTGLYHPEDVVLSCSRPVLVVPYAGRRPDRIGENVLIAWNGSREASRAVQDALPFMSASSAVTVLLVDPDDELADVELAQDLVAHLGRHGLNAKTQMIRHDLATLAVSDTIFTHVAELDADLLVMGAYSHSRFREIAGYECTGPDGPLNKTSRFALRRLDLDHVGPSLGHQQARVRPLIDLAEIEHDNAGERPVGVSRHQRGFFVRDIEAA